MATTVTGLRKGQNGTVNINYMIPTNGTPVNGVASQGTLTVDTQVTADDTITIGTTTYTFKAGATAAAGEIGIGDNVAACKLAIVAAINGTDTKNTAHALVTAAAFVGDDCVITAQTKGVAGDEIATTSSLTTETNVFDATTLGTTTAGVDGTVGVAGQCHIDDSYLYYCLNANAISGANWRRVSLGSAY